MLDYALLEALRAVVSTGSFDKAARALHVTPSAVSQRVKLLEERIGKVLVVRAQPCVATDAGEALCRHTEHVALLEHDLGRALPGTSHDAPTLRIAVNADSVATWFVYAVAPLARELGLVFDIIIDDQDHTANLLRRGAVQAAVTTSAAAVRGCEVTPLGRLRFIATCAPAFKRRHFARGVAKETLASAPCLVFDNKNRLQHRFMRRIAKTDLQPPVSVVPSSHGLLAACLADMAWAMNPEPLVREHLRSGALVELVANRPIDVRLFWQRFRLPSATMDALTAHVSRAAKRELL